MWDSDRGNSIIGFPSLTEAPRTKRNSILAASQPVVNHARSILSLLRKSSCQEVRWVLGRKYISFCSALNTGSEVLLLVLSPLCQSLRCAIRLSIQETRSCLVYSNFLWIVGAWSQKKKNTQLWNFCPYFKQYNFQTTKLGLILV